MTVDRQSQAPSNTAGDGVGSAVAESITEEIAALWAKTRLPLDSVAGTNAITATCTPAITALVYGMSFVFYPANTTTGAATLNIDGTGAVDIVRRDGNATAAGDIVAGQATEVWFDGTDLVLTLDPAPLFGSGKVAVFAYSQSDSTAGGTATSGGPQTYPLNTEVLNDTVGASINTGTGEFTLTAGDYEIEAFAAFYRVNTAQLRLYNVTDAVYETGFAGNVGWSKSGADQNGEISARGRISITSTKSFRLEYQVETTRATDGLGQASSFSWGAEYYGLCVLREILPIDLGARNVDMLGINLDADATHKLAGAMAAALLQAIIAADGGTGDFLLRLVKESAGDDVRLRFETNHSGRADIGLLANDDLTVRVSPDGAAWEVVLTVDKDNGFPQFAQPVGLNSSTVAGLPAAADYEGAMIYVSDETGGAVPAFSDGTDWRRVTDRAVVS